MPVPNKPKFLDSYRPVERHSRRLPHRQQGGITYFVTWRLADAMPKSEFMKLQFERDIWLNGHPQPWSRETESEYWKRFGDRIDQMLDVGRGSCLLNQKKIRRIVDHALMHFDEKRYSLLSFVTMPNHVHALFALHQGNKLQQTIQSWKSFTSKTINKKLHRNGRLWQPEYWDKMIRGEKHLLKVKEYIRNNPIKARLRPHQFSFYEASTQT